MAKKSKKPKPATFGELFKALREVAGYDTRYKLAKVVSLSHGVDLRNEPIKFMGTIGAIETDRGLPKLGTVQTLIEAAEWEMVFDPKALTIKFQPKRTK